LDVGDNIFDVGVVNDCLFDGIDGFIEGLVDAASKICVALETFVFRV